MFLLDLLVQEASNKNGLVVYEDFVSKVFAVQQHLEHGGGKEHAPSRMSILSRSTPAVLTLMDQREPPMMPRGATS